MLCCPKVVLSCTVVLEDVVLCCVLCRVILNWLRDVLCSPNGVLLFAVLFINGVVLSVVCSKRCCPTVLVVMCYIKMVLRCAILF